MDLLTATQRIKKALSRRDYIAELTHYHFKDGHVFASNGAMTASAPVNDKLEHVVPADEFDRALNILGTDAEMVWDAQFLTVKKGHRRMSIQLLQPEMVSHIEPVSNRIAVPPHFTEGLSKIRPFISDDATKPWALTAWLTKLNGKHVFIATNNVSIAQVDADEDGYNIEPEVDVQIPNFAIDFVLGRDEKLQYIGVDSNKMTFFFDDFSQMTSLLFTEKMMEKVKELTSSIPDDHPCFILSKEWRDAYSDMEKLSPDEVQFNRNTMTAGRRQAKLEVEIVNQVPRSEGREYSVWNPKFLTPVVKIADAIDFGSYPKPSYFYGKGVRGLTIGKFI